MFPTNAILMYYWLQYKKNWFVTKVIIALFYFGETLSSEFRIFFIADNDYEGFLRNGIIRYLQERKSNHSATCILV